MSIVEFLSQPLWQRLGLTLVHFLWQGLAVVVLVGALVRVLRLKHGNTRYAAYLLAFIAMIICPVVTFTVIDIPISSNAELVIEAEFTEVIDSPPYTALPAVDILPEADTSMPDISNPAAMTDSIPLGERISGWLNVSMPWVLVIWMVGVIVLSVRLVMGFVGVYRWRHNLEPLPERLARRVASLTDGLGMRSFWRVFISPTVLQAMAVGYLRPMVLLPAAMITQMQPEMLEAVIAHELAHIRRFDLWINLAQRVAETLLFYHPAVWWLSNCIRTERELCCDELAVKATGERITYASTLESVGRARFVAKQPVLAAGLGHDNKPTLSRVRHILGLDNKRKDSRYWLAGVIAVLLIMALIIPTGSALIARLEDKSAVQVEGEEVETRVIHFPKDRSMGLVHVGELRTLDPLWWQGWEIAGEAQGDVRVPINKEVRLDISTEASEDISPLAALGPDDIQAITFTWNRCDINDSDLKNLSGLTGLRYIGLGSTKIRGQGLDYLRELSALETLRLSRTMIDDDGLKYVARIKSLRRLGLDGTQITDSGLSHLASLDSLELLTLYRTNITGKGFSYLAGSSSLRGIWLNFSEITDDGLEHLAKLKALEILSLFNTNIGDRGLAHLSKSTSLRELELKRTNVTDEGLDYVAKLISLEKLELPRGTTDAGLAKLKGLTGLKRLDIGRMQLTGVGIETLKEFKLLEYLQLPQGINDSDLAVVKGLSSLEELWIQNSPVTNEGLANLTLLKSLRKLGLHNGRNDRNMEVTGSGLAYLKGLPLTYLQLGQIKLDDSRLNYIAGFTQLEDLSINQMPLRDEDLANLSKLSKLKRLFFDSETVSDGGIAHLAGLTALEDFAPIVPMTDVGLSYLANMNRLDRLQIKGDFSDEGLGHLEKLKSLRTLRITSANDFSPASLEQLQKKLPFLQSFTVNKSREIKSRPKAREVAPTFSLKTLKGKDIKLEDYRGKVVLLYFWATWCSPCVASTPALKNFYEELSEYDDFVMIGMSLDRGEFGLGRHIEKNKLTWPQIRLGLHSQVAADYGVSGVPAYILIGPDGKILTSDVRDWNAIKATVASILGASGDNNPAVQVEGGESTGSKGRLIKPEIVKTSDGRAKLLYFSRHVISSDLARLVAEKIDFITDKDITRDDGKNQISIACPTTGDAETVLKFLQAVDVQPLQVQIDFHVVETYSDVELDWETRVAATNITRTKTFPGLELEAALSVPDILREAAKTEPQPENSIEKLIDLLTSRGYIKILMNPRLEVVSGHTAKIMSREHVPIGQKTTVNPTTGVSTVSTVYEDIVDSLEVTAQVFADMSIGLQTEGVITSVTMPKSDEQIPIVTKRHITKGEYRVKNGHSLVVGTVTKTEKQPIIRNGAKDSQERTKEVLVILTPTIITPKRNLSKKPAVQVEGGESMRSKLKDSGTVVPDEYPPTTCKGKVIDVNGNQLGRIKVAAYEMFFTMAGGLDMRLIGETVTKTDGAFVFETRPSVKKSRSMGGIVVAQKEGLSVGWAHWPLYGDQQVAITSGKPVKMAGRVVDENGKEIANAEVRAVLFKKKSSENDETKWLPGIKPSRWLAVRTDRKGQFEFNNIPPDIRADFVVSAAGFSTIYTHKPENLSAGYEGAEFIAGQTDIEVELAAEGRIEGKVIDSKSEGVAGVKLAVVPTFSPVFFERFVCISREDGTFSIGGLRSGEYLIRGIFPNAYAKVKSGQETDVQVEVERPDDAPTSANRAVQVEGGDAQGKSAIKGGDNKTASENKGITAERLLEKMLESRAKAKNLQFVAEYDIHNAVYGEAMAKQVIESMREKGVSEQLLQMQARALKNIPKYGFQILKCTVDNLGYAKIERTNGSYDSSGSKVLSGERYISSWDGISGTDFNQRKNSPGFATIKDVAPFGASKQGQPWRIFTGTFINALSKAISSGRQITVNKMEDGTCHVVFEDDILKRVATVDPSKGYTCTLEEYYRKEQLSHRRTARYEEVTKGVWFPVFGEMKSYLNDGSLRSKSSVATRQIKVNEPGFNRSYFKVDFPEGTEVQDHLKGKNYVVGSDKIYELPRAQKSSLKTDAKEVDDNATEDTADEIDSNSWQKGFDTVYRLADNEVLKWIEPPFIPEREHYFLNQPHRKSSNTPYHAVMRYVFHWDGELSRWGALVGSGIPRLDSVLESVIGLGNFEYQAPDKLLHLPMPGDWIVRKGASKKELLEALEKILWEDTGKEIHFEKRSVDEDVIVVQGKYQFEPLADLRKSNAVHIYTDDLNSGSGGGGGSGTLDKFLKWVGNRVNMRLIDQTDSTDVKMSWRNHYSSSLSKLEHNEAYNEKLQLLLHNLAHQTGLTFKKQSDVVEKWFVIGAEGDVQVAPEKTGQVNKTTDQQEKAQVAIEARLLLVDENFLEDVGLNFKNLDTDNKLPKATVYTGTPTEGETTQEPLKMDTIDNLGADFFIRAAQFHKNSSVLTLPKVLILDGEPAEIAVTKDIHYVASFTEPNAPSLPSEPKTDTFIKGIQLKVLPRITSDKKHLLLKIDLETSSLLGWQEYMHKDKYHYKLHKLPIIEKITIDTRVAVADKDTVLLGGLEITPVDWSQSTGDFTISEPKARRTLLFLIKPTIVPQREPESDVIEVIE